MTATRESIPGESISGKSILGESAPASEGTARIRVGISVHGHVTEFFPGKKGKFQVELLGPSSIREILIGLQVKPELIATTLVNGQRRDKDYLPEDGDEVVFISPAAGG